MKKIFLMFLVFSLISGVGHAKADTVSDSEAEAQEELNAFGYPDKSYVTTIISQSQENEEDKGPALQVDCNDENLLNQVRDILKEQIHYKGNSIVDRRKNILVFKNIANFKNISVDDINPDEYPAVAGRMIELKINNHLENSNIQVCESLNPVLKLKIYLFLYRDNGQVAVEILNLGNKVLPRFVLEN